VARHSSGKFYHRGSRAFYRAAENMPGLPWYWGCPGIQTVKSAYDEQRTLISHDQVLAAHSLQPIRRLPLAISLP
jgi:hypothetical protein